MKILKTSGRLCSKNIKLTPIVTEHAETDIPYYQSLFVLCDM